MLSSSRLPSPNSWVKKSGRREERNIHNVAYHQFCFKTPLKVQEMKKWGFFYNRFAIQLSLDLAFLPLERYVTEILKPSTLLFVQCIIWKCSNMDLHQNPLQRGSGEWCPCPMEEQGGPLLPPLSFHCHWKTMSLRRRHWRWSHAWGEREGGRGNSM